MGHRISRLLLAGWFFGILALAVRETPAQGQMPSGPVHFLPLLAGNSIFQSDPGLRDYVALFVSGGQDAQEIYTVRGDGSKLARLTNDAHKQRTPAWSADGSHIAYVTQPPGQPSALMVMAADGSNSRPLISGAHSYDITFMWSPAAPLLLAEVNDGNDYARVFLARLDGTPPQLLATEPYFHNRDQGWSPDGRFVHFNRTDASGQSLELWTLELATSAVRMVNRNAGSPRWTPDGQQLVFIEHLDVGDRWVAAAPDGSSTRPVIDLPYRVEGWVLGNRYFLLRAPDGNLAMMSVEGGAIVPLTSHGYGVSEVQIAPHGQGLLYSAAGDGGYVHWLDLQAGGPPVQLDVSCGAHCIVDTASWAADGSSVLFTRLLHHRQASTSVYYARLTPTGVTATRIVDYLDNIWGVEYLPFSSRLGMAKLVQLDYPYYPPPHRDYPVMLDTEGNSVPGFPYVNELFEFGGWRYSP